MKCYFVEVFEPNTDEVVKRIQCPTKQRAERVEQGVFINLNHQKYSTRITYYQGDKDDNALLKEMGLIE